MAATPDDELASATAALQEHSDPAAVRLCEIAETRGLLTAELSEIGRAHEAAEHAAEHMREAAEFLVSARSWSAYDTWWGGGFVTSWMKRNNLDTVAEEVRAADAALKPFTAELSDVHTEVLKLVEVGPLTRYFDVWFDNPFTDLSVRDRIIAAQKKVDEARAGVREFQTTLPQRAHRCTGELARLDEERVAILSLPGRERA